jgi:ABC-type lipoprotein export system ATPase subunit/GNAT superfamily N-acetyltransferase
MSIFKKYDLVDVDESFPIPDLPTTGIIFIVGSSGSGKSTILNKNGFIKSNYCKNTPIYKQFSNEENAEKLLIACGLRTIPCWKRSPSNLSNGECHRFEIAIGIDKGIYFIDEFTSVVDRNTAKSLSVAINKYYHKSNNKRLVIASCHYDVIEWLQPDHIYNTDTRQWQERGSLRQRPPLTIQLQSVIGKDVWSIFKKHHYLSGKLNDSCNAFLATIDDIPVAFTSILAFPNRHFINAWRGHRTVVLPEFQGMGIGNSISDAIGEYLFLRGYTLYSKTSHPSMGEHRENSSNWVGTSQNRTSRNAYKLDGSKEDTHKMKHAHRVCYSHKFIPSDDLIRHKIENTRLYMIISQLIISEHEREMDEIFE